MLSLILIRLSRSVSGTFRVTNVFLFASVLEIYYICKTKSTAIATVLKDREVTHSVEPKALSDKNDALPLYFNLIRRISYICHSAPHHGRASQKH